LPPTLATASTAHTPGRRNDLDWIRVAAFGLLILYHVGLVYAPWDWHVHSAHSYAWLQPASLVTSPWRLTLLFLVSGAAVRLMSRRLTPGAVLKSRMARLAPPLIFGVLVLVPPQSFIEAVSKGSWSQGFGAWWLAEFSPAGLADGVPLNHLWFVLYIGVYTLAAAALLAAPKALAGLEVLLDRALSGWRVLAVPILYLVVVRQLLFPWFGLSNHLPVDWYNHAVSLAAFLAGFALVGNAGFWTTLERLRWVALGLAAVALPLLMALEVHPGGMAFRGLVKNTMHGIDQWAVMAAILGFGSRHLRAAQGPALGYLTQAIFPCYLAHQTILVAVAAWLKPTGLPVAAEAPLLIAATLGGSLLVYEAVRRIDWMRPLWGLKPAQRRPAPIATAPALTLIAANPAPAPEPALRVEPVLREEKARRAG
jgi:surface polysaccharide O-acyltransferase-like enzyme